jgi:hypothetical protein
VLVGVSGVDVISCGVPVGNWAMASPPIELWAARMAHSSTPVLPIVNRICTGLFMVLASRPIGNCFAWE